MITMPPTSMPAGVVQNEFDAPAATLAETAAPPQVEAASDPLARLALTDLHPDVQSLVYSPPGYGGDIDSRLDRLFPGADRQGWTEGRATPLYQNQQPPGVGPTQPAIAAPPAPRPPIDLRRMEGLNRIVQAYDVNGNIPAKAEILRDDLASAKAGFQAATDALKAGDYAKAETILRSLDFPLPSDRGLQAPRFVAMTAILLGVPVKVNAKGSAEMGEIKWGAHGHQGLNDVNGFAANAIMINRMASVPGGVSNPPTEAQATTYMRDLANTAQGKPATAREILQAASEITAGTIMHYSSAGALDPKYGPNPNPHAYYKDASSQIREFASMDAAKQAARDGKPPIEPKGRVVPVIARSPDEWSDIASAGTRAGRYIGDCESKVYLQTRLLTDAGFTSLGSVDVERKDGASGHMFGVFKAPDGTIWVTSNEEFRQVKPSAAGQGVTQADLDGALRDMTAEMFHVEPNYKGELDLSDFTLAAAATGNLSGPDAGVASIRRSTELNQLGQSEAMIPPPPKPDSAARP